MSPEFRNWADGLGLPNSSSHTLLMTPSMLSNGYVTFRILLRVLADIKQCKANAKFLGINPESIVVGGGSAGGNIAAVLAQMARDEKVSGVLGQVLNIPVTCHPAVFPAKEFEYGSWDQNKDASIIDAPKMQWLWDKYVSEADAANPYASPLLAKDLSGLPPACKYPLLPPVRKE